MVVDGCDRSRVIDLRKEGAVDGGGRPWMRRRANETGGLLNRLGTSAFHCPKKNSFSDSRMLTMIDFVAIIGQRSTVANHRFSDSCLSESVSDSSLGNGLPIVASIARCHAAKELSRSRPTATSWVGS